MANHPIVHLDIPAEDTAAAAQFYARAFGWHTEHSAEADYWMFSQEGGPGGGFVQPGSPSLAGPPYEASKVVFYINTDDIDASLAQVEAAGGRRLGQKVDMGQWGAYAFFADPSGNTIGLYTPGANAG